MKKLIAMLLALVMLLGLAACGKSEPVAEVTEPTVPPTMAPYVPAEKTVYVQIHETEADLAANFAVESDIEIITMTYGSIQEQIAQLEQIAADSNGDGSVGVVLKPAGEDVANVLSELVEANVSYALAGYIPESAAAASVANVHYDYRQIGAAAAAYLVNAGMQQKNDVVILEGPSAEDALKTEGFKLYLEGKMEVNGATIETPWESFATLAYSEMETATRDGARLYFEGYMEDGDRAYTGYFAAWDDAYLLGILDALKDENIGQTSRDHLYAMKPVFTGFGADAELCELLQAHEDLAEDAELTKTDKILNKFKGMNTIVNDATMLVQAAQAMVDHMEGEVVAQEQLLPVTWWKEPTVVTEE